MCVEPNLPQRAAAVNKEPPGGRQCCGDGWQRALPRRRVAAVERADAHGEREIIRRFARRQLELFDRHLAHDESPHRDLRGSIALYLADGGRGPIDREDHPVADAPSHGARCGSRTAADLEYPEPGSQR